MPSFIERTVNKTGGWTSVSVVPLTRKHLEFWHSFAQPYIDMMGAQKRTDTKWNWYTLASLCRVAGIRQNPAAFAITYENTELGKTGVCALIQLARNFVYLPDLRSLFETQTMSQANIYGIVMKDFGFSSAIQPHRYLDLYRQIRYKEFSP